MRENTQAIITSPEFTLSDFGPKGKWGHLKFSSPRALIEFTRKHARSLNEQNKWALRDPKWAGLGAQSVSSLDSTGIAEHPLALARKALASLPQKRTRPGKISPTVTGGSWVVPAVLAGLPLAARSRIRSKLAPLTIRLVCTWSSSVKDETLAPIFAKLARAINDYILAGGAVNLTLFYIGFHYKAPIPGSKGLVCEVRVPTNDLAQLSTACSLIGFRTLCGPLCTAYSAASADSIPVPTEQQNPIPSSLYLGGRTTSGDISGSINAVIKTLEIS